VSVALTLSLQTNAMLVDPEWIDIFERNRVRVGVSLDGPAEYNDKAGRFPGQRHHDATVRGLRLLQDSARRGPQQGWGAVRHRSAYPARTIYRYFVDELA